MRPEADEASVVAIAKRWNLTEEMARRRWRRETTDGMDYYNAIQYATETHIRNNEPLSFTASEVASYYAERVPKLKPGTASERRGPCPIS